MFFFILFEKIRLPKILTLVLFIFESFFDFFITILLPRQFGISYLYTDVLSIVMFILFQYIMFKNEHANFIIVLAIHLILNFFSWLFVISLLLIQEFFLQNNSFLQLSLPFLFQMITIPIFYKVSKFIKLNFSIIKQNITLNHLFILFCPTLLQYSLFYFYTFLKDKEYLILLAISTSITIVLLISLYRQLKISEERTQNIIFTNLLKTSKEQMNQIIENEDALKEIRHDLKNHLIVMQGLLKDKKYNQLEIYFNDITPMFDVHQPKIYCQNIYLNTLLNHKVAEYQNIDFHIQIHPSFCRHFSDVDLYILISNLLDNAIQELSIHPSLIQEIEILLTIEDAFQIIKIRNPLSQTKTLKTEKIDSENHGIGLSIIKKLVKKYDGEILIKQDTYFEVKIVFCLT